MLTKFKVTPINFFVFVSIIFGLMFIYLFPPMVAPDEVGHFTKAYAFSESKIIPQFKKDSNFKTWNNYGFYLPDDIYDLNVDSIPMIYNPKLKYKREIINDKKYELSLKNKKFVALGGQLNYSFIQYIPQIIGIVIARFFSTSLVFIYYSARLFNLLFYILITSFAIKLFKFSKWAVVLVALNPLLLELVTSTSGDGFTDSISFLFSSILLSIIFDKKYEKKLLYLSFVLIIAMIQMKPTLIVFGLIYLLIPNDKFHFSKKIMYGLSIFLISIIIYTLWGKLFPNQQIMYTDFTNPAFQSKFLISNPISFLKIIKNTILLHSKFLVTSFSGQFSALNRNLPTFLILLYYIVIAISSLSKIDYEYPKFRLKISIGIIIVVYIILTFVALFQIWTPVGSEVISGLQGRYFIPLSLLFVVLFSGKRFGLKEKYIKGISIAFTLFLLVYCTWFLVNSYGIS